MDPRVGLQESESSVVNEILGISLPKRSAPVAIPQHSTSSNRFIPPGYEKSNVFHSGDPVLTSSERSDKDGRSDRSSYNDRPSGGEQQQRRHSFRDRLKQRVDYTSSDNSPSTRPRFLNTNKKAAKAKEHFAKGPDGTLGFHFTRTVAAEPKDLVGSPTLLPTPKSSPSSSPTGSPRETSSLTSISASPTMSRSSSSPARRPATAATTSYSQPNSSPALLPFRHSYTLPPLELPTQAQQAQAEAFFSQFNQPNQQSLSRRSSGTSVGSPQLSNYIPQQQSYQQQSYQNSSPYLGNTRQLSPPALPATIFGSDPYFSAFAVTSSSSQSQSQGPFQSQPDNRRLSNEGSLPSGTPVVVIPQLPVDDSRGSGTGRNGSGDKGRYYPPSLSMVPVPVPLAGGGSTGHPQGHPYAPELRRISSDQSSNRPKGGPTSSNTFPLSSSPENSPAEQGSHETSSPHQSVRSPPLYRYQKKVTPSQSPQGQSPLDPVPLTRAQSAEMPKQTETNTSTSTSSKPGGGSPILQYKPVQNSTTIQVPKSFGQPLQRDRGGSSEKNDASTNSGTNNNTPSSNNRSLFQPVWKPKAKSDTERLRAEFEINSKADEIEQQKQKTQEKEMEKARELERLRQREIDEDEKRRERERLRALERRQEIERVEAEQRAIQRQRQIEEAKEQARLAELERQAKQRASERLDLENAYENQRRLIELQALEKLKEFERAEERARLKEIERAEERARQKEYEEHERRTKLQHQHKTSSLSETWKKKEFFPEFVPSSPIASGEKKSYDPPLARPWPVTVPPQSVPQDPEWDTVPPQDYTSNPTLQQQSSISTGFPPLPEVIGRKREQTKPQIGSTHKFPKNEKKVQESASSQWTPQEEDIEKQAALLYFYSENLIGQPKLEPEQQVESVRLAMSASTSSSKKLADPRLTKSSVPLPTTMVKKESDFTGKEEDEPKKEIKRFIPFNQKAVERASGIKVPASVLESNLQDQRDELMALRSIFDADFQREGDKPPSAQSLPSDIYRIKIKPVGAGNSSVELRFTYPPTYPSHGPPAVSVTSDAWLTPYAIQLLQNNLEKLLQESESQVVVYTLATWIQEESWSYLMSRSSYSNPIVIHFSPLAPPKRTLRTTQENPKPSPPQQFSFIQPVKYQRGHPLTVSEGKQKTTIVAFMARVRTLGQVQQLIRDIKEKQKAKPTSPKLQGHTEQYLVAYRFASTDRSPVNEGSDGDEFGAGGSSESILRLLQKLNLYDVSVVVRLRWASPPGSDVHKKMLTHILTLIKDGGVNQGEGVG